MAELNFSTGIEELTVNGVRTIRFNPADIGFVDTLYSLMAKVEAIESENQRKREKLDDPSKIFDNFRNTDKKMREAVDAVFGEGFCEDVYAGVRLVAIDKTTSLSVLENFIFAVLDHMDESIREGLDNRESRIAKYTEKYRNYKK